MSFFKRRKSGDDADPKHEEDIRSRLAFHLPVHNQSMDQDVPYSDDDDDDDEPVVKQAKTLSRNESEKRRRDRLNMYIGELAQLVPSITGSSKKMDKSSILRLTVNYLRIYHDIVRTVGRRHVWCPDTLSGHQLGSLLLESIGGFLLVISNKGNLIFASDGITEQLGHSLVEILGFPLYNIIHHEDHEVLQQQLPEPESSFNTMASQSGKNESGHRSFYLRILNNTNRQISKYETVHIIGHLKNTPNINDGPGQPEMCLISVARLDIVETPKEIVPVLDMAANEWYSHHRLDGKVLFSDHRTSLLTGFFPTESAGLSAYSLLHPDDISSVVAVHNMFLTTGEILECTFRMYTKMRDVLYIQTHTQMIVDKWTRQPRFIASRNIVIPEEDGLVKLRAQRRSLFSAEEDQMKEVEMREESTASSAAASASSADEEEDVIVPEMQVMDPKTVCIVVGEDKYKIMLKKLDYLDIGQSSMQTESPAAAMLNTQQFSTVDSENHASAEQLKQPDFVGVRKRGLPSVGSAEWQIMRQNSRESSAYSSEVSPLSSRSSFEADTSPGRRRNDDVFMNSSNGHNCIRPPKTLKERNPGLLKLLTSKPESGAKKSRTVSSVMLTGCGGISQPFSSSPKDQKELQIETEESQICPASFSEQNGVHTSPLSAGQENLETLLQYRKELSIQLRQTNQQLGSVSEQLEQHMRHQNHVMCLQQLHKLRGLEEGKKQQEASLKELGNKYLEIVMSMPGAGSADNEEVTRMKINLRSEAEEASSSSWTNYSYTGGYTGGLQHTTSPTETVVQQQPDSSVKDEDFLFPLNNSTDNHFVQPLAIVNLPYGQRGNSADAALGNLHQPSTSTAPVNHYTSPCVGIEQEHLMNHEQSERAGCSLSPDTTTLSPTHIQAQSAASSARQYHAEFDSFPILDLMDDCL